jgi:hypothetical protein
LAGAVKISRGIKKGRRVKSLDVDAQNRVVSCLKTSASGLAWLMLKRKRMTNTEFILREKTGAEHLPFAPSGRAGETRFGVTDAALILGILVAFVGLIFLLAR